MLTINMLTRADSVKGQGVMSATEEQINLVTEGLNGYNVVVNQLKIADINHIHTINPDFLFKSFLNNKKQPTIASVHFLPETLEKSISLPKPIKELFYKYVLSFYKQADYLVTVNPRFIDDLEKYGVDRSKVTYIPNFVKCQISNLFGLVTSLLKVSLKVVKKLWNTWMIFQITFTSLDLWSAIV